MIRTISLGLAIAILSSSVTATDDASASTINNNTSNTNADTNASTDDKVDSPVNVTTGSGPVYSGQIQTTAEAKADTVDKPKKMPSSPGEYLVRLGDCRACHTQEGGQSFAGGYPMQSPIGTMYSANITPDKATGIGNWSYEQFEQALRHGKAPNGKYLYPAMPYTSYVLMPDDDVRALYDYFMKEVKPVHQPNKEGISWPLNIRFPLLFWDGLFLQSGPYKNDPNQSEEWNRGAYIVTGPAHCGACHTPRGIAMEEKAVNATQSGYLSGANLNGWYAFNITPDLETGIGSWSENDITQYLKTGSNGHAQAAGPMGEAVAHSFSYLSDADLKAIAVYLKSVPALKTQVSKSSEGVVKARNDWGKPTEDVYALRGQAFDANQPSAVQLYMGNCATCHSFTGTGVPDGYYPSLVKNSAVGAPPEQIENLVKVVLTGVQRDRVFMPAFGQTLNDREIADLVNYVTSQFGNPQSQVTPEQVKNLRPPKPTQ